MPASPSDMNCKDFCEAISGLNIVKYTLTVNQPTGGTVTATGINCGTGGNDCSEQYDENEIVTLTATEDTGKTFTGWTGDLSGTTNPIDLTMDANKIIGAGFEQPAPVCDIFNINPYYRIMDTNNYELPNCSTATCEVDVYHGWDFNVVSGECEKSYFAYGQGKFGESKIPCGGSVIYRCTPIVDNSNTTVSFWIKILTNELDNRTRLIDFWQYNNDWSFAFDWTDNTYKFDNPNAGIVNIYTDANRDTIGQWTHWAIRTSGAIGYWYMNGNLVYTETLMPDKLTNMEIEAMDDKEICHLRAFQSSCSEIQIQELYNETPYEVYKYWGKLSILNFTTADSKFQRNVSSLTYDTTSKKFVWYFDTPQKDDNYELSMGFNGNCDFVNCFYEINKYTDRVEFVFGNNSDKADLNPTTRYEVYIQRTYTNARIRAGTNYGTTGNPYTRHFLSDGIRDYNNIGYIQETNWQDYRLDFANSVIKNNYRVYFHDYGTQDAYVTNLAKYNDYIVFSYKRTGGGLPSQPIEDMEIIITW